MKLEEIRNDDIGTMIAMVVNADQVPIIKPLLTFQEYCGIAFYLTCQAIEQLEKSKQIINQGNTTILAAGMWFISIEAFINFLLKIACCVKNTSFDDFKKKDIGARLNDLLFILNVPSEDFRRSGIFQRLEEFKTFRNELFHDRWWNADLDFRRTAFCRNPTYANQVDAIQGGIIALEIFHAFRGVYQGLDLMPCIKVAKSDSFGWIKYDVLFNELLSVYFEKALEKHSLTTDLALIPQLLRLDTTRILGSSRIHIAIKSTTEESYRFAPNEEETSIGSELMEQIRQTITNTPDTFPDPRYMIPT